MIRTQISLRVDEELVDRIERMTKILNENTWARGTTISKSSTVRMAIHKGLDVLEAQHRRSR